MPYSSYVNALEPQAMGKGIAVHDVQFCVVQYNNSTPYCTEHRGNFALVWQRCNIACSMLRTPYKACISEALEPGDGGGPTEC